MSQLLEQPKILKTRPSRYSVDISDMKVSSCPGDILVTYSLGSCVGLALYDPVECIGGMAHCMLPMSKLDREKAKINPYIFVDTGISALMTELFALGATRENLVAKVAGAGSPMGGDETFRIGQRNYSILRKVLWKNNILIENEDVGGPRARTLYLYMQDGRTLVKSSGQEVEL